MNFKDLSQIDVKDVIRHKLDKKTLQTFYKENLFLIINISICLIIFVSFFVTSSLNKKNLATLDYKIKETTKKLSTYQILKNNQENFNNFIEAYPKEISGDELISRISELALTHNIQIVSFSPTRAKENDFAEFVAINIKISTKNYTDAISFLQDIEHSPYAIRVNKWQSTANYSNRRSNNDTLEDELPTINATVEIGSIKLKNV